jgi:hypothetical protein
MKLSASVRKKNAIEEVLKSGIAFRDKDAEALAVLSGIETKHGVSLWWERNRVVTARTPRTPVTKWWISDATLSVYAEARKKNAIDAVFKSRIAFENMDVGAFAIQKEIETLHGVKLFIAPDIYVSAWTQNTPITRRWVSDADREDARKKNAIEAVLKSGIAFKDMGEEDFAVQKAIETEHGVSLLISENHAIEAWVRRTDVLTKLIDEATIAVYVKKDLWRCSHV